MVAGIAWALSSFGSTPQNVPPRGVRTAGPRPVRAPPTREEPRAPEPEAVPVPPRPSVPVDDIPVPEASPENGQLDEATEERAASAEPNIPEWKWDLARRRVQITMYATQWCGVCRKAREYMKTNQIDFIELDTEESPAAGERLGELNPRRTIPTFEIDEQVYVGFQESLFEAKINQAARKYL
jgi:glutaredoxin